MPVPNSRRRKQLSEVSPASCSALALGLVFEAGPEMGLGFPGFSPAQVKVSKVVVHIVELEPVLWNGSEQGLCFQQVPQGLTIVCMVHRLVGQCFLEETCLASGKMAIRSLSKEAEEFDPALLRQVQEGPI